jgi:hypothetical protein
MSWFRRAYYYCTEHYPWSWWTFVTDYPEMCANLPIYMRREWQRAQWW